MRALIALASVVLFLASCSTGERAGVDGSSQTPPSFSTLPGPSELHLRPTPPRTAADSASSSALEQRGGNYLAAPANRVSVIGTAGDFDPAYVDGSGPADLAYAAYQFDVTGYAGAPELTPVWIDPPAADSVYIGLANWADDVWNWYAAPAAGNPLVLDDLAPYSDAGKLVVAVVCLGTARSNLGLIRIGDGPAGPHWRMTQLSAAGVEMSQLKLFEFQGRPAVVYWRHNIVAVPNTSQIVLKRALDDVGETWGPLQTCWDVPVDSPYTGGVQALYPLIVDGALSIIVAANGDDSDFIMRVHYLRAADAAATSFATPTLAYEAFDGNAVIDSELAGGQAAFMDFNLFDDTYSFRRATDAAGASWAGGDIDPEVVLAGKFPFGLLTANGLLGALYPYQSLPGPNGYEVRFAHATDADVSGWATPVVALAPPGGNAAIWEVTLTAGRPAFLYSTGPGIFAFTAALNIAGDSWPLAGTPVADLDNVTTMAVEQIGGVPALGYTRNDPDTLYFRPATTALGVAWEAAQEVHIGAYAEDPTMAEFGTAPAIAGMWDAGANNYPVFHIYR